MNRLTRRSKVGEWFPVKHLNLMHMDTTSEDTLTEILDALAEFENVQEKIITRIKEIKESSNYPHNFKGQMVEDLEWVLSLLN